jgi:hypothetical protein
MVEFVILSVGLFIHIYVSQLIICIPYIDVPIFPLQQFISTADKEKYFKIKKELAGR